LKKKELENSSQTERLVYIYSKLSTPILNTVGASARVRDR